MQAITTFMETLRRLLITIFQLFTFTLSKSLNKLCCCRKKVCCCCRRAKKKSKYYLGSEVSDKSRKLKEENVKLINFKKLLNDEEKSNDYSAARL